MSIAASILVLVVSCSAVFGMRMTHRSCMTGGRDPATCVAYVSFGSAAQRRLRVYNIFLTSATSKVVLNVSFVRGDETYARGSIVVSRGPGAVDCPRLPPRRGSDLRASGKRRSRPSAPLDVRRLHDAIRETHILTVRLHNFVCARIERRHLQGRIRGTLLYHRAPLRPTTRSGCSAAEIETVGRRHRSSQACACRLLADDVEGVQESDDREVERGDVRHAPSFP